MSDQELLDIAPLLDATELTAHIERRRRVMLLWQRALELRREGNTALAMRFVQAAELLQLNMFDGKRRRPTEVVTTR